MAAMKWYNALCCTNTHPNPYVADRFDFLGRTPSLLTRGKRVAKWDARAKLWTDNADDDGTPDDVLQHCMVAVPVFSQPLRQALEDGGISGIQYLDVRVVRPDGTPITGYSVANIMNLLPALDVEKSMLTRFDDPDPACPKRSGQISSILKPVLKGDIVDGYDIFRLAEFSLRYYVSQRFRDIFMRGKYTGYTFAEVPLS
jgi:hypothetical protein